MKQTCCGIPRFLNNSQQFRKIGEFFRRFANVAADCIGHSLWQHTHRSVGNKDFISDNGKTVGAERLVGQNRSKEIHLFALHRKAAKAKESRIEEEERKLGSRTPILGSGPVPTRPSRTAETARMQLPGSRRVLSRITFQ